MKIGLNSTELKALGELTEAELELQADAAMDYISKFTGEERREELTKWFESKDFKTQDLIQILLILFIDKGVYANLTRFS